MWAALAVVEVLRTIVSAAISVIFLGAQITTVETRRHSGTPFVWLLAASLLTSIVEIAMLERSGQPVEASILYMLGLVFQIDHLWPCSTKEREEMKPAWHAHLLCWCAMFVSDALAAIRLILKIDPSTFDVVCLAVAVLRCSIVLALFFLFMRAGTGWIRLPDDSEGSDGVALEAPPMLWSSIRDEIQTAGGVWSWTKKFYIFKDYIWPAGLPWLQVCMAAAVALKLGVTAVALASPSINAAYIDSIGRAYADHNPEVIWGPMVALALANFASLALDNLQKLLWKKFALSRAQQAQCRIHEYLMNHDAHFHDANNTSDIIGAARNGIAICEALDFVVLEMMPRFLSLVGAAFALFSLYGHQVAFVQLSVVVFHTIIARRQQRTHMPLTDAAMQAGQETARRRREALGGWTSVALNGQAHSEIETYAGHVTKQTDLASKRQVISYIFSLALDVPVSVGFFVAAALVALRGLQTGGTVGLVVAFRGYWNLLQTPLLFFTRIPQRVVADLYKADRLRRLLEASPTMTYGEEDLHLAGGSVQFKHVTFNYPGQKGPLFRDLCFTIKPGETTAIVGPSGVGKTTLLKLIRRFYEPTTGSVEIDGQDVRVLKRGALETAIAYMEQEPFIFSDTVASNIKYGRPDATMREVQEAAKLAGIDTQIVSWEKQYNTLLTKHGCKISGGQKQRIALARTFLRKPSLLFFDEPTSALDVDTEAHIKNSIQVHFPNTTRVIIAHRLSSIQDASNIIVFKDECGCGKIAEEGTHSQLLAFDGVYKRLWDRSNGTAEHDDVEALYRYEES